MRPAYMTSTRSQTCRTTATSWLMSRRATPSASRIDCEQAEHLLLDGDVQGGRRLVGDDERRAAHEPHADHGALPHAARELVGILSGAPLGGRHVDGSQAVDGACVGLRAAHAQVVTAHLGELAADPAGRVEGGHRVLEHHRQRGAQQVAVQALAAVQQVRAQQAQARGCHAPGSSMSCATASAVSDLPEPDSPTMPTASPGSTPEGHDRGPVAPGPAASGKVTLRSRTSSSASRSAARPSSSGPAERLRDRASPAGTATRRRRWHPAGAARPLPAS